MCACVGDSESWNVGVHMNIRPSSSTGVIFALVYNNTVPLSIAVVTQGEGEAVSPVKLSNTFDLYVCLSPHINRHTHIDTRD